MRLLKQETNDREAQSDALCDARDNAKRNTIEDRLRQVQRQSPNGNCARWELHSVFHWIPIKAVSAVVRQQM